MRHPTEGVLRRLLDEPTGVSTSDRQHIADCPHCATMLAAARRDADVVGAALGTPTDVDLDAAWLRLSSAVSAERPAAVSTPSRTKRSSAFVRRPAAAAAAFAVVLAGAGTAAANDWLQIFRTEKLAPVAITTGDFVALPDLSAYGELTATSVLEPHQVRDAAAATEESGLEAPTVADLPKGVTDDPTYQVFGKSSVEFTFSAERAAAAAAATGSELPPVPKGLDGNTVQLTVGPGVAGVWPQGAGRPALIVGQIVAPSASSSGVSFDVVRDYLLSLPGLPADVAAQLRAFTADSSTLPLPFPADEFVEGTAVIDGIPANVLQTNDRSMTVVVWVRDGVVNVVAGSLDLAEIRQVAEDLQ